MQSAFAQQQGRTDDVIRVFTELVQTDVMVFDKDGHFVNGLKREDFELKIDGKVKPVDFFEKIVAGSVSEESQIAAARGATRRSPNGAAATPLDRGRPIFFYVDDLHLDPRGVKSTQSLINRFIDREMGQNDEVAVTSTSGRIGFLQQLTENKAVLREAIKRISYQSYNVTDFETPKMTEYSALQIENNDQDVLNYYVTELLKQNPGLVRETAVSMVNTRARVLLIQAANITANTLRGLDTLVRQAQDLPGRKLVFFISNGFFLDTRNSDTIDRLRRITSAAARNGVVIYSMDARGLVADLGDITTSEPFDPTGTMMRAARGELIASQDGLNALAKDTGGRAIFNTNTLEPALKSAISETSNYYLLAWKPDQEKLQPGKFRRIEVRVAGRPELRVQVRRGFYDLEPEPETAKDDSKKQPTPAATPKQSELRKAISSPYPKHDLPVLLRLNHINTPTKGDMLSASLQVPTEALSFSNIKGKLTAVVTVAGTVFNVDGEAGGTFSKKFTVTSTTDVLTTAGQNLVYGYSLYLKPGLYHVRAGARDETSGKAGTSHTWIEIPDFNANTLNLSSLLIGARVDPPVAPASASEPANDADIRFGYQFSKNEFLRFLVFVYNASISPTDSKPDVAIQVQVVRDDQPVVTAPQKKVTLDGVEDLKRIPYAAEISLAGLPPGRYMLQVSVVDRVAKKSASQQARFDIE